MDLFPLAAIFLLHKKILSKFLQVKIPPGTGKPCCGDDGASVGNDHSASVVIKKSLKNPDSYVEKYSKVVWTGVTHEGHDATVVKVKYKAKNSYGAYIDSCVYIPYWEVGDNIRWRNTGGSFEPCEGLVRNMSGSDEKYIEYLASLNFEKE